MLTSEAIIAAEAATMRASQRTLHERLCDLLKAYKDAADTDRPLTRAYLLNKVGDDLELCVEIALRQQNEMTARDDRIAYLERRLDSALHPRVTY